MAMQLSHAVLLAQKFRTLWRHSDTNPAYRLAVWVENQLRHRLEQRGELLGEQSNWRRAAEQATIRRRVLSEREKLVRAMTPARHGPTGNRTA
jgi:hypothetical protein